MTMFQFQCKYRRLRRYLLAPSFFAVVAIVAVLAAAASASTLTNPEGNPFTQALDFKPKVYQAMVGWTCSGAKMGIQTDNVGKLMLTSLFLAGEISPMDWANHMAKVDPKRAASYGRMAEACSGGPRT